MSSNRNGGSRGGTGSLLEGGGRRPASLLDAVAEDDPVERFRAARARRDADRPEPEQEETQGWLARLFGAPEKRGREERAEDPAVSAHDASFAADEAEPEVGPGRVVRETGAARDAAPERRRRDEREPERELFHEPAPWNPLVDPAAVIGEIWRSRLSILALGLICAVLAALIALSMPRSYSASAELLVDPREWRLSERELNFSGLQSDSVLAIIENQVRVLTSRPVLAETVDRLGLANDGEFNGEGLGGFSPLGALAALRQLISFSSESGAGGDPRREHAIENLGRSLSVGRSDRTFVVVVGVTTTSPEKSALIANTLTDAFLGAYGRIVATSSGRAADEFSARLDELRAGVERAERAVETFKAENEIIDAQGRLITDDEMLRLNQQLSDAKARTVELNARAASARDLSVEAVLAGTLPEQIASAAMTELRAQHNSLRLAADRLAVRLGPRHPERVAAEAQVAGAARQIEAELRRIMASLQVDLRRAVQLEQDLASELARLKVRQSQLGGELVTLRELEREAAAQRAVYESYLMRARETGEQREINIANVSVIAEAVPPLRPSGMSRLAMSAAGGFLGLALGIGLAGARGAWRDLSNRPAPPPPNTPRDTRRPRARQPRREEPASRPRQDTAHAYAANAATTTHAQQESDPMYRDPRFPQAPHDPWASPYQAYGPYFAPPPHAPYGAQPYGHASAWPAWPPQPMPYPPQAYGPPAYAAQPMPQPVPPPVPREDERRRETEMEAEIREIRESLRDFRDAIDQLNEDRWSRRRYGT